MSSICGDWVIRCSITCIVFQEDEPSQSQRPRARYCLTSNKLSGPLNKGILPENSVNLNLQYSNVDESQHPEDE